MRAECQHCGSKLKDGWTLCGSCRKQYAATLHALHVTLRNLKQIANREVKLERAGHASHVTPQTPIDLAALDLYDAAWDRISTIAATISIWGTGDRLLTRMQTHMADLCRTRTAGSDYNTLATLLNRVRQRCERPTVKPFAGRCPSCGTNIEATPDETIARCTCGMIVDCAALREATIREFQRVHITTTPAGAARWASTQTGVRVTRKDIENWMRRGTLDAKPDDDHYYQYPIAQLLRHARSKPSRLHVEAVS